MIRAYCRLLLFLSVCLALAGGNAAESREELENLVLNPDFELPNIEPWWLWIEDWNAVQATLKRDNAERHTGRWSALVEIEKGGKNQRVELHQMHFNLKKGQELTYAFWAKNDGERFRQAEMFACHRAAPWTTYGKRGLLISGEWTEFWTPVHLSRDDDLVGIAVELKDGMKGRVWFDHFRLYEGDYIDENPRIAVEPLGKLAATWAAIKNER